MAWSQDVLPDYWLSQPPMGLSADECRACDALLASARAHGASTSAPAPLAYTLTIPKWQFLCYVAAQHNVALHGSSSGDIACFEPRQPSDYDEFGAQNAVYAAADGIWPLYFAIVDRTKSPTLVNSCISLEDAEGAMSKPYYCFSISQEAMARQPYGNGYVYLLPSPTFVRQPAFRHDPWLVHVAQLASPEPVTPLAKLAVTPEDFPFLAQMRTHDDARLGLYAEAMGQALPWPE